MVIGLVSKTQRAGLFNKLIADDSRDALAQYVMGEKACHAKAALQSVTVATSGYWELQALQRHELFYGESTRETKEVGKENFRLKIVEGGKFDFNFLCHVDEEFRNIVDKG